MLRAVLSGLLFFALLLAGADADARYRDWRDAVKAGDYPAAYEDLFQTWRNGTPEPRAQALRNAWRDPKIVAVAREDFLRRMRPIADSHTGDLASLRKAIRKGPIEDRVDFAVVVDRKLEVDREIERAFAAKGQGKPAAATAPVAPAAGKPPVVPVAQPSPAPGQKPLTAPAGSSPAPSPPVTALAAAASGSAATAPASPASPASKASPAPPPPAAPSPWSLNLPGVDPGAVERATRTDLPPDVAAAKARSVWRCKGAAECDRGWGAAESFVMSNANMRIRTAKPPLIETYPPITPGEIGLRVDRVDVGDGVAELRLTVACRAAKLRQACTTAELRLYPAFPAFLQSSR